MVRRENGAISEDSHIASFRNAARRDASAHRMRQEGCCYVSPLRNKAPQFLSAQETHKCMSLYIVVLERPKTP